MLTLPNLARRVFAPTLIGSGLVLLSIHASPALADYAGDTPPTAEQVAKIVSGVCLATAPDFDGAVQAMAAEGVTRSDSEEAGLTYHTELNLSMKVWEQDGAMICSTVFFPADEPDQIDAAVKDAIGQRLGTSDFAPSDYDNIDQFTSRAGDVLLLWKSHDAGDGLYQLAVIHE